MVKRLPNGEILFLGRVQEDQVKIHGIRVNYSEIENVLIQMPGIKSARVRANQKQTDLIAYVIPDRQEQQQRLDVTTKSMRSFCREYLAHSLIPRELIILEKFPLTTNDKIDLHCPKHVGSIGTESTEIEDNSTGIERNNIENQQPKKLQNQDNPYFSGKKLQRKIARIIWNTLCPGQEQEFGNFIYL